MPASVRVHVANLRDGGVFYWLVRLYLFAGLALALVGVACGLGVYAHFAGELPPVPELSRYAAESPGVTGLYALDGTMLGEFEIGRAHV